MANLKNITDLPIIESADGVNLIVNDNGNAKQIAASEIGGGGGVFIIDTTASDFSTTDTVYGNTIKEALLKGKTVYYYDGTYYFSVIAFYINETTTGEVQLRVYASGYASTTGVTIEGKLYTFVITL